MESITEIPVSFFHLYAYFLASKGLNAHHDEVGPHKREVTPMFLANPPLYHEPLAQRMLALTSCS